VLPAVLVLWHLPGVFVLPPIDRDEARFAEASRRMVAEGTWERYIVPMVQDAPRLNKPPLVYWLQSAAVRVMGVAWGSRTGSGPVPQEGVSGRTGCRPVPQGTGGVWAYRLPSVLAAALAGVLTWRIGVSMFGGAAGLWAGVLLSTCVVVSLDARQARADQVLLAATVAAQWALWSIWRRRAATGTAWGWVILLWVALGLGVMTKLIVTPAVVFATALALCVLGRAWRWMLRTRPLIGVVIVGALVLPWVVSAAGIVGWDTLLSTYRDEVLGRGMGAQEGHAGWPGYYTVLAVVLFWPGSLMLVPAVVRGWRRGLAPGPGASATWWRRVWEGWCARRHGRDAERFCLAWLVPGWVMFELAGTRLPHYVMPMLPALALLAGRAAAGGPRAWQVVTQTGAGGVALWAWVGLTVVIALVLPVGVAWAGDWAGGAALQVALGMLLVVMVGLLVALGRAVWGRRLGRAQAVAIGTAAVLQTALLQFVLPRLGRVWLSSRVVARLAEIDPTGVRPVAAAGYHEDSLVFLTRGAIARLEWWALPDWLDAHPRGLAVVGEAMFELDVPLKTLERVSGFNYSNGRMQRLRIVARASSDGGAGRLEPGGRSPQAEAAERETAAGNAGERAGAAEAGDDVDREQRESDAADDVGHEVPLEGDA
jgi:4-amino-4-deoxy-L-arabinose transferase-like glycosyltransferase